MQAGIKASGFKGSWSKVSGFQAMWVSGFSQGFRVQGSLAPGFWVKEYGDAPVWVRLRSIVSLALF